MVIRDDQLPVPASRVLRPYLDRGENRTLQSGLLLTRQCCLHPLSRILYGQIRADGSLGPVIIDFGPVSSVDITRCEGSKVDDGSVAMLDLGGNEAGAQHACIADHGCA